MTSAFSRSSNGVPATTAGDGLGAVTADVAELLGVGDGLPEADGEPLALPVGGRQVRPLSR